MFLPFKNITPNRGFTLLELIVVIAIFMVITSVVLMDIPNFKESGSLDLVAQSVATYIRGAQVYGTSMVVSPKVNNENYPAYGIRFSKNSNIFALYSGDCSSGGETCRIVDSIKKENYEIPSRFKITKICSDNNCNLNDIDIIFMRPKPTAYFVKINPVISDFVSIEISSINNANNSRCVSIYRVGQIRVKSNQCS